jgi:signal peptidase I
VNTLGRFLVWTIVILAVLLGIGRAVAFRWFRLPVNDPIFETSVMPTLAGGDLVVALRLTRPTFGDLVVCPEPNYPDRYVIGRIVGEAGDTVRIVDGKPFVNGAGFKTERACDPQIFTYPDPNNDAEEIKQTCDWEALANHLHMVGTFGNNKVTPAEVEMDVTEGKLFLLSDNRLHHYDSRDFGLIDQATCKETVVLRLVGKDGWMDSDRRLDYIQ